MAILLRGLAFIYQYAYSNHMQTLVNTQREQRIGLLLLVFSGMLWGTIGIATEAIYRVAETNPLSIGFLRMAISSPVLLLICWHKFGRQTFRVTRSDLGLMFLMGLAMALYQVFYFAAIAQVGVMIAGLVTLCTAPVITVLLSGALLGERLTRRVLFALAAAVLGTILLVGRVGPPTSGIFDASQQAYTFGIMLALAGGLWYASVTLCSRVLANRYHALQAITISFTASAIILLPFAIPTGLVVSYPIAGWLWLLHMGLIPTAFAYLLFFASLRHITASMAGITIMLVEPLTSTVLAWLLFGQRLTPQGLLGGAFLLAALWLLYKKDS